MMHNNEDNKTIGIALTAAQQRAVIVAVQVLKCNMRITHPDTLIEEITYTLLDPTCYTAAGNNFEFKLKLITQSIYDRIWKPSPRYQEMLLQQHRHQEIQKLQAELEAAYEHLAYCNTMFAQSQDNPATNSSYKEDLMETLEHIQKLKQRLHVLKPINKGDPSC